MMYLLIIVGHVWFGPGAPAKPTRAATVLAEVEKFYASTKQVSAKFGQKVTNTFGDTQSSGSVYLTKPGKMRWDYTDKKSKKTKTSFISNGTYLYVVEKQKLQVMKKNLSADVMPVAVAFLQGKAKLSSQFDARIDTSGTFGGKDDIVLELTPKQPSAQYKSLRLVVAADNYRVKQSIITDSSDSTNAFTFYEPDFERALDDKLFEFDPRTAKNYRIIDADQKPATK